MKNVKLMYAVKFFFWMHFFAAVIIPFFTQWGGLKFSEVLYLNAWFMFWIFLLEIPTGTIADFISRKASISLASISGIIAVLIYISFPHIAVFMVGEIFFAISFTLMSGADEALIYDSLVDDKMEKGSKKIFSRLESFKLGGIVIGALLGGVIAKFMGLRAPVLFMVFPISISLIISLFLKEPEVDRKKEKEPYTSILKKGVKFFFRSKTLKILTLDMVFVNSLAWLIIWFYQPFLSKAGVAILYFGIVHSFMSLSQIFVISNFSGLEKLLRTKKNLLILTTLLPGISFIILGISDNFIPIIAAILLCSAFGLSRGPLFSNYLNKFIPSGERATVLSTISMLRTFMIVILNPIAGLLGDWSISGTMIILGILLIIFTFLSPVREKHLID